MSPSSNSLGYWSWASLFKKAFYSSPLLWYAHHERVNKSLLIVRISDLFPRVRERLFTIQCPLSFLVQSVFLEPANIRYVRLSLRSLSSRLRLWNRLKLTSGVLLETSCISLLWVIHQQVDRTMAKREEENLEISGDNAVVSIVPLKIEEYHL